MIQHNLIKLLFKNCIKAIRVFLIILILGIINIGNTRACVDYHPTPPPVTVRYDSSFTHIEITVHDLLLFGGSSGEFCTCAFSSYTTGFFSSVYYIAFVDSGTQNPVQGFDPWFLDANATGEWSSVMPGLSYPGYLSSVNLFGLPSGQDVELIVRATLPPGYTLNLIDSTLSQSFIGTDAWDNINQSLSNMHQSISGLGPSNFINVSGNYFTAIEEPSSAESLIVYPNPTIGSFTLKTKISGVFSFEEIIIIDALGQDISDRCIIKINSNKEVVVTLPTELSGMLFISIDGQKNWSKVIVQ